MDVEDLRRAAQPFFPETKCGKVFTEGFTSGPYYDKAPEPQKSCG